MKRTRITPDFSRFPEEFHSLLARGAVYDSSCSPEARVWFLDTEEGFYLKTSACGTLKAEAAMTDYFYKKGLGAPVISYLSGGADWLLTARVPGEDCTHPEYLANPRRLCDCLAEQLRRLHETDASGCPVPDRMESYFATVAEHYRAGQYDLSFFPGATSPEEAYGQVERFGRDLTDRVLLHGDYCLPNIMLDRWRFSGFIDLGNGGVGDRHIDLFWGAWTLQFNLKTDVYRQRFFDAYGRDRIDPEKLRTVGAAEVFG